MRKLQTAIYTILVLLMYLPLLPGARETLKGWTLYTYWIIIALASLTTAAVTRWGGEQ